MYVTDKNQSPRLSAIAAVIAWMGMHATAVAQDSKSNLAAAAKEVLRSNCSECHSEGDARADVRVLDLASLIEAGHVVPKRPDDSYLYQLITSTDDDVMPPNSRPPLSGEQIATIRRWIAAGAEAFPADAKKTQDPVGPQDQRPSVDGADPRVAKSSGSSQTSGAPQGATEAFATNREVLSAILDYVRATPKADRAFLRFFSLRHLLEGGVTPQRINEHRVALAKAINHLSRERDVMIPKLVDAAGTVLAIDLRKLGWHQKALREVTESESETEQLNLFDLVLLEYPYSVLPADSDSFDDVATEFLSVAAQVRPIPYVRADWFCSVVLQPPLYHDMLQLPLTLDELEADLGVDVKSNLDAGLAKRAGMTVSGVSRNNRVVERHPHRDGYYHKSSDFLSNVGRENILTNPIDFRASGGEMIFRLPNGMQGYYVSDGLGNRLDEAPTSIVVDKFASDRVVRNGLGCIRCHRKGIKDFSDSVRSVLETLPGKPGFDKRKALELYPTNSVWDDLIESDQQLFAEAMAKIGQETTRIEPLTTVTSDYLEGTLSVVEAAAELGVDAEQLKMSCRAPGFTRLGLSPLASGGVIRRDAWEDNFDAAALLLGAGTPVVPVDGNLRLNFVPSLELDRIELLTNKENRFFEPGDDLKITVKNNSSRAIQFELYGTSVEGLKVRLTDSVQTLAAGESFRFPQPGEEFIEIRGGTGRELITLFASTQTLPAGKVFRGKNIADRVVHGLFDARGVDRASVDNVIKKTIVIETR